MSVQFPSLARTASESLPTALSNKESRNLFVQCFLKLFSDVVVLYELWLSFVCARFRHSDKQSLKFFQIFRLALSDDVQVELIPFPLKMVCQVIRQPRPKAAGKTYVENVPIRSKDIHSTLAPSYEFPETLEMLLNRLNRHAFDVRKYKRLLFCRLWSFGWHPSNVRQFVAGRQYAREVGEGRTPHRLHGWSAATNNR